jgi:hypothetical protein
MNKGIVMEIDASEIIVMTSEGKFAKIPLGQRICQIGEEIAFSLVERRRTPWLKLSSLVAAAAVVLLLLFNVMSGFDKSANNHIAAYVSIDINPSVEMGINENDIVLEIRGLNEDGAQLIKNLNFANKTVDSLTEDLLQAAEKMYLSKGEGDIVISSTMGENTNGKSKVNDVLLSSKLKAVALQHIEKSHPEQKNNYQVTAFAAPQEIRKVAESKGLSAGKYSIYLKAKDNGQKTTIEDLKKESVHSIAKKSGGIDKLIQSDDLSKEKISALLKDDESGELDRKLIKKQMEKKNEDKKKEDKKKEDKKNDDKKNISKKIEDKRNQDGKKEVKKNQDKSNQDNRSSNNESENKSSGSQSYNKSTRLKDGKSRSDNNEVVLKPVSTPSPNISDKKYWDKDREQQKENEKEKYKRKDKDKDKATDPIVKMHNNNNYNREDESGD